jgi:Skp family chaperone for outer membrane proteins
MASRTLAAAVGLLLATSFHARADENQTRSTEDTAFANVQKYFAEAYNRPDVDAVAAAIIATP